MFHKKQKFVLTKVGLFTEAKVRCWNKFCDHYLKLISVYTWGLGPWPDSCPEEGRPATVQFRYSKTIDASYWVNVCPHCDKIQGDYFLYCEPDGPFFGMGQEPDPAAGRSNDDGQVSPSEKDMTNTDKNRVAR
jgi:hypothetical protein